MLESSIRLSQAHARLMFRNQILLQDVVLVVLLMEQTLMSNLVDMSFSALLTESDYPEAETEVLKKLGIDTNELEDLGGDCTNVTNEVTIPNSEGKDIFAKEGIDDLFAKYSDLLV